MVGVQGAKPPEADEFLHVKGGFIKIMIMYILKKYVIFFPNGGGSGGGEPVLDPPLPASNSKTTFLYLIVM